MEEICNKIGEDSRERTYMHEKQLITGERKSEKETKGEGIINR